VSKSNHRSFLIRSIFSGILLCILCFSNNLYAQIRINGVVYYDEDPENPTAKVKIFKDNQLYEELNTNKKGRFKVLLQLGHDFLFEVSKDYHFTTRFVVSTKLPEEKMQEDVYATFDIETDLIKNYVGLDGSIMDKPIMILRYIPGENKFDFDRAHLRAVQSRVDRLMDESERLESKGASPIVKPIPRNARKVEGKTPEIKPPPEIKEPEQVLSSASHEEVLEENTSDLVEEDVSSEKKADANESYEMRMRRERLEREKQKRANLALKRGYESSLIRQVAEENRKMSSAEVQQKTKEKQDSSMIEKARVENEVKRYKSQQREEQTARAVETSENKQTKTQMETGLIREVASSNRDSKASKVESYQKETTAGAVSYKIDPKIRERTQTINFSTVEDLWLEYPSYTIQFSKETYDFGMVNYYIDKQAVDKAKFCQELAALKAYKIKLKCD
tara:strand:+ start:649 stop:1992 length:1344 start_codon:yes stop_codon:yes gene_type:complete